MKNAPSSTSAGVTTRGKKNRTPGARSSSSRSRRTPAKKKMKADAKSPPESLPPQEEMKVPPELEKAKVLRPPLKELNANAPSSGSGAPSGLKPSTPDGQELRNIIQAELEKFFNSKPSAEEPAKLPNEFVDSKPPVEQAAKMKPAIMQTVQAPPPLRHPVPFPTIHPSATAAAAAAPSIASISTPQQATSQRSMKPPPVIRPKNPSTQRIWSYDSKGRHQYADVSTPPGDAKKIPSVTASPLFTRSVVFNPNQPYTVDQKHALINGDINKMPPAPIFNPPPSECHAVAHGRIFNPYGATTASAAGAPNFNPYAAASPKSQAVVEMDNASMMVMAASIQNFYETDKGKEQQEKLGVTSGHNTEMYRCYDDLVNFIVEKGCSDLMLFPQQVTMIPGPSLSRKMVPRVLVDLGGEKKTDKTRLCNIIMCQWARQLKNMRDPTQHLQPSTHARKVRTLFGFMKKECDWRFSVDSDFNGQGELQAVIKNLFEERQDESKQNPEMKPYGTGANKQIVSNISSVAELDWTVFDESDPAQMAMKVMSIFGSFFGFRGRKEHAQMTVNNLTHGMFEAGHLFEGHYYFGLQDLWDKSNKLTFFNQTARETNITRIPVIDRDDQADPGGTIHRFLKMLSPGQQRLYCYEASKEERARWAHV